MAVSLSFEQRKFILKCYWKYENAVEVQRQFRIEFQKDPPTQLTITHIRDNFEANGTVDEDEVNEELIMKEEFFDPPLDLTPEHDCKFLPKSKRAADESSEILPLNFCHNKEMVEISKDEFDDPPLDSSAGHECGFHTKAKLPADEPSEILPQDLPHMEVEISEDIEIKDGFEDTLLDSSAKHECKFHTKAKPAVDEPSEILPHDLSHTKYSLRKHPKRKHPKSLQISETDEDFAILHTQKERKRPTRPCYFCGKFERDLPNHYTRLHHKEPEVQRIKNLIGKERLWYLRSLRMKGIEKENEKRLKSSNKDVILQNRKLTCLSMKKRCNFCKGFFSRKYFYKHKTSCIASEDRSFGTSGLVAVLKTKSKVEREYQTSVLNSLKNDDLTSTIINNEQIYKLGLYLFSHLRRKKSFTTNRRSVPTHIRSLALLYKVFNKALEKKEESSVSMYEMFDCSKLTLLKDVMKDISNFHNKYQPSTHLRLGYCIKTAAKSLITIHTDEDQLEESTKVEDFLTHFNYRWAKNFGSLQKDILHAKIQTCRLPQNLPKEKHIKILEEYLESKLKIYSGITARDWKTDSFVQLRRVTFCMITIFNGQRPAEVSTLHINTWLKAKNNEYLPELELQENDVSEITKKFKICYNNPSKNQEDVSIIFPKITWPCLEILASTDVRSKVGVNSQNNFLFPSVYQKRKPIQGYGDLLLCCKEAKVCVTGVRNQHRLAATILGWQNISKHSKEILMRHFSHS